MEQRSFLDDSSVKLVFDHFRNMFIASTVTGIGFYSGKFFLENGNNFKGGIAIFVVLIGFALFAYNVAHISNRTWESKISNWWLLLLVPIYFGVGEFIYSFLYQQQFGL